MLESVLNVINIATFGTMNVIYAQRINLDENKQGRQSFLYNHNHNIFSIDSSSGDN